MTARRSRGDGGLYWSEPRQRWIAEITTGYTPAGKRIVRKASGKTKTEAKAKLKEALRDYDDGLAISPHSFTVADAVNDWIGYGLTGRSARTIEKCEYLCRVHIVPDLGARKLRELSATDVDRWLSAKTGTLSTRTLRELHSCLNRAIKRAMARDKVKRNVVALCGIPTGAAGRPSRSLNFDQAVAILRTAEGEDDRISAYVVLSLLTGARTEELRALTWDHVDLDGRPNDDPPIPASIQVWHSVRVGGDTKTKKSRRTLALPDRCVTALRRHRRLQDEKRVIAGSSWQEFGLVFTTNVGTALDAANVRRAFRRVVIKSKITPVKWSPRELRHSFVSILSSSGVPIEKIADLCGHAGTTVTEKVYRHQLRPVLLDGATVMDLIFKDPHVSESNAEAPEQGV